MMDPSPFCSGPWSSRNQPRPPRLRSPCSRTVSELLASFIGESLTTRLLREAWPDDFAGDTTEETIT